MSAGLDRRRFIETAGLTAAQLWKTALGTPT
jgi:hypothetical protein